MARRRSGGFGGSSRRSSSSSKSSGGGLFSRGSSSKPAASKRSAAPAAQQQQQQQGLMQQQPQQGGGMLSGLVGAVVQGAAFGTGSSLAHRAMDGVMGPRTVEHVHHDVADNMESGGGIVHHEGANQVAANNADRCKFENNDFLQCLRDNDNQAGQCKFFFDVLQQCQSNSQEWQ